MDIKSRAEEKVLIYHAEKGIIIKKTGRKGVDLMKICYKDRHCDKSCTCRDCKNFMANGFMDGSGDCFGHRVSETGYCNLFIKKENGDSGNP